MPKINEEKVVSIQDGWRVRMIRDLQKNGPLPVSYLCIRYGADAFLDALLSGIVGLCNQAMVFLVDEKKWQR